MMKSGGIHISNSLVQMLGWRRSSLCAYQGAGLAEQDVNPYVAGTILPQKQFLFHQHTRAWPSNTDMLKNFGIKPIVLIRNVADVIVSVLDDMKKDHQRPLDPKLLPGIWVPKDFDLMSILERETFLARNLGPWLLSFYASWRTQTDVQCLWVRYEDHFADQMASFRRMLTWIGQPIRCTEEGLEKIAQQRHFNFNVGRVGRGQLLGTEAKHILLELAEGWGPKWTPSILRDLFSTTNDSGARQMSCPAKQA